MATEAMRLIYLDGKDYGKDVFETNFNMSFRDCGRNPAAWEREIEEVMTNSIHGDVYGYDVLEKYATKHLEEQGASEEELEDPEIIDEASQTMLDEWYRGIYDGYTEALEKRLGIKL